MNINREIWRLGVPAIVSNVTVPLLGLSDTAISGHLGSSSFIGAIAVGTMMMNAAFWLFGFLRMGTTGLTAQAYGAGDTAACCRLLLQSMMLGSLIGLAIVATKVPLMALLLSLIAPDGEVAALAAQYFRICIWYAPASLATMAVLGWFLGMQDTVRPMAISIGVNVLNIILSVIFVFGFGMGFRGVAIGTLVANWVGLLVALLLVARFLAQRGILLSTLLSNIADLDLFTGLRRFFGINVDIFFRSACIMGVTLGMTAIGARIGTLELAANAVIMQLFLFFSYFMDGMAFTGEALVGRFVGAADRTMLQRSVLAVIKWSLAIAAVFFAVYAVAGQRIISLLTSQDDVVAYASSMRLWFVLIPPLTVAAFVYDGFFIGLTATRQMLAATATAALVFFAMALVHPFGFQLIALPSNGLLWSAFLVYLILRGVLLAVLMPGAVRKAVKRVISG